ncbi:unnamed protein product [Linum tenue]|uniref:Glycosyltransferase n=1 Tax=Linum tenue TaxID=586396 RepID=A0AAV0PTF1_9ROSI|nr:unnamed protein product [Linum tenue]
MMQSTPSGKQQKPHAVLLPCPAQGHINPFMQLAKLLHLQGFHITFVNTEHNHRRLVRTGGPEAVKGLPDFQFQAIPDGLPPSDIDATQDPAALCYATQNYCLEPFLELIDKLKSSPDDIPPVSCIVSDGVMTFGIRAAEILGVRHATFWTASACGFLGYLQFDELIRRGISPLKDANLVDGTLESPLGWILGMRNIRLRDLPSFATTMDVDDVAFHFVRTETRNCLKSSGAIIFNTFDAFEEPALEAIRTNFGDQVYKIGPLHLLGKEMYEPETESKSISLNLWKEDLKCTEWLDEKEPQSVVYVNYGSMAVMSDDHLKEFAWGLAESKRPFLWIIRSDIAMGSSAILPTEFLEEIKGRGCLAGWCLQQEVLSHPAVGVFLTHCGWNSTMESVSAGVPMICWPFYAEQQTNCRYACTEWGIGVELSQDVKRNEVVDAVEEMMNGEAGKVMKHKALEWQKRAREAVGVQGSSFESFMQFLLDYDHKNKHRLAGSI